MQFGDLVQETSSSTGTTDFTLSAMDGRQTFNQAFSTGGSSRFPYFISHQSAAEWECGLGHMSDATTLVRDTVLQSSNSDALVNFAAGIKDVMNDLPAQYQSGVGHAMLMAMVMG
jgi:hypothetical protein